MSVALPEIETPVRPSVADALRRIDKGAGDWTAYALLAVDTAACANGDLTSDAAWRILTSHDVPFPDEPRAMGAVMVKASRLGIIERTNDFRLEDPPATKRHSGRPQRVFRSRIFGQHPAQWPEGKAVIAPSIAEQERHYNAWRCPRCGRGLRDVLVTGGVGIGDCVEHGRQRTQRRAP